MIKIIVYELETYCDLFVMQSTGLYKTQTILHSNCEMILTRSTVGLSFHYLTFYNLFFIPMNGVSRSVKDIIMSL